jgi:ATP-dependent RNA helicase DeaD
VISFEGLGIEEGLLQSIHTLGFTQPTPIQEKAIPFYCREQKILLALLKQERAKQLRWITLVAAHQ